MHYCCAGVGLLLVVANPVRVKVNLPVCNGLVTVACFCTVGDLELSLLCMRQVVGCTYRTTFFTGLGFTVSLGVTGFLGKTGFALNLASNYVYFYYITCARGVFFTTGKPRLVFD